MISRKYAANRAAVRNERTTPMRNANCPRSGRNVERYGRLRNSASRPTIAQLCHEPQSQSDRSASRPKPA